MDNLILRYIQQRLRLFPASKNAGGTSPAKGMPFPHRLLSHQTDPKKSKSETHDHLDPTHIYIDAE